VTRRQRKKEFIMSLIKFDDLSDQDRKNPTELHTLKATPSNCHWGYFSASVPPAVMVKSGDLIQAEALTHHAGDDPDLMMDRDMQDLWSGIPEADRYPGVHIMTGPIYVKDAEPGDMLEVNYLKMQPRFSYGSNLAANWGHLYDEFDNQERVTIYRLDMGTMQASGHYAYNFDGMYKTPGKITRCPICSREAALKGVRVPMRPHLGTAGVAPNTLERVSSIPPGAHGGNIDNWRIGAGSTMFYPVQVRGGLFSIGDPHVSQGDGEISGTAIEASLDVTMQIVLRKDFNFPTPLLQTPNFWIVHGFNEDLNVAMKNASLDMLELLTEHRGLSRADAYSLMSVAGDFTVTQVVDTVQGIHVKIPRYMFDSGTPEQ
jgi:acetamidase/formamidase